MGNTAHLKFRKRITLSNFHYWLQRALMATFGDALILDGKDTDKGSNLRNEEGVCLVQFWYESKGHISVDHRHGATGYMVSDAMLAWLARHLNGRVFETGTGSYMDLTRDYPLYFMDVVLASNYKALEGDNFTGKFARFWDKECWS